MIYYCLYIVYYIEYRDLWKGIESLPPAMEWEKHLYQNLPHTGCQLNPQKMVNGPLLGTIWGFPKIVVPQNGWFTEENPIKMEDLRIPPFKETPIWHPNWKVQVCTVSGILYLNLPILENLMTQPVFTLRN